MKKTPVVRGVLAYLLAASAILAVVMWRFLSFEAAYLYKDVGADGITFYYPHLRLIFSSLSSAGLPGWSFSQGLGQNIYPFSWNDPFLLVLFPFRGANLPFGLAYREAAKILAAGVFFYLYLRELKLREKTSIAGALLFSFSGYMIVGSGWGPFSTEAAHCAFILYAFERFLRRDSWAPLPAAIALLSLQQPFFLFPYALFFALYGTVRFLDERGWNGGAYARFMLRFAGSAALGAACSGVLLLGEVSQMLESPRVGGHASFVHRLLASPVFAPADLVQSVAALLRLYSSDLLGTGDRFQGWQNYLEAPIFYCGLVCLLLVPQAFAAMDRRRRRLYGLLVSAVLLPVIFPFFRYAFWAFSGDYYRSLSLFVAVVLLFLSLRALSRIEETSRVQPAVLAGSLAAALFLLYAVPAFVKAPVDHGLQGVVAGLLVVYAALLFAMGSKKYARLTIGVLLVLVGLEAAWSSRRTINEREFVSASELSEKTGYNDFTVDAVAFLKSSDPSFFRVEKDYRSNPTPHRGFNDPQAQDYYGTSSYASFNQAAYVSFLAELGVLDPADEDSTRWLQGLRTRGKLMSLASVKYFLYKDVSRLPARFAKDLVGTFGDVRAYRNRRALPLGFTYDRCLPLDEFRPLDAAGKDAALLDAFVADGASCLGFPRFSAAAAPRDAEARYDAAVRARSADALTIDARGQNLVAGGISLRERKLLFFSIPYDAGWTARVDGAPARLARVDIGFMALPLEPGTHRVELRFTPPLRGLGAALSLAGLGLYGFLLARARSTRTRSS
jgi:uncharacterized membrane protein YfhO